MASSMNSNPIFPIKLHRLLTQAERKGYDDVISWLPDGKSFKVHDKVKFERQIMPSHFGTSRFRSFQKNLNMWGFKTIRGGVDRGECSHPLFIVNCAFLCHRMVRRTALNETAKGEEAEKTKPSPTTPAKETATKPSPSSPTATAQQDTNSSSSSFVSDDEEEEKDSQTRTKHKKIAQEVKEQEEAKEIHNATVLGNNAARQDLPLAYLLSRQGNPGSQAGYMQQAASLQGSRSGNDVIAGQLQNANVLNLRGRRSVEDILAASSSTSGSDSRMDLLSSLSARRPMLENQAAAMMGGARPPHNQNRGMRRTVSMLSTINEEFRPVPPQLVVRKYAAQQTPGSSVADMSPLAQSSLYGAAGTTNNTLAFGSNLWNSPLAATNTYPSRVANAATAATAAASMSPSHSNRFDATNTGNSTMPLVNEMLLLESNTQKEIQRQQAMLNLQRELVEMESRRLFVVAELNRLRNNVPTSVARQGDSGGLPLARHEDEGMDDKTNNLPRKSTDH